MRGMSRRHFMQHLAGASALALPAITFTNALAANAADLKKRHKSAIMLWMGGGPATIDIWDLKPGAPTGGPFKPIATSGDEQISEHMPLMAKQMHKHGHHPLDEHPRSRSHAAAGTTCTPAMCPIRTSSIPATARSSATSCTSRICGLEIPPFVSVGGGSVGPGFLGMTYAPFVVGSDGNVRNLNMGMRRSRSCSAWRCCGRSKTAS